MPVNHKASAHGSGFFHGAIYLPPAIASSLRLLQLSDPVEVNHFDYFRSECTKEFSDFFNPVLWQQIVMQAAHSELFILHAVLAISSLRRVQLDKGTSGSVLETSTVARYTARKYAMALQALHQRLHDHTVDWRLVALGSLVFLAIEVLQGHEQEAIIHFRSGEAILKSLGSCRSIALELEPSKLSFVQVKSDHDAISDDIITAFTRISVEEELFIDVSSPNSIALPHLPAIFESVSAAQTALNSVMAAVFSFFRRNGNDLVKTLPFAPLSNNILAEFFHIQNTLQSWYTSFISLPLPRTLDTHTSMTVNILLVYYHTTSIRLSTYFHYSELIYDQYYTQFEIIIDLSSEIIALQIILPNLKGPCYTLDLAIAQPLYFTACKCRNLALRMRAVEEMKKVGNNGIYSGRNVAKIAEWIVRAEHELNTLDDFVPEEKRLRDIHFDFDRDRRVGVVTATRRMYDGSCEILTEELQLS